MDGETTLIDEQVARLHAHRNNIARYRSLLETPLTDLERHFIEDRLTEEKSAIESLVASTLACSPPAIECWEGAPETSAMSQTFNAAVSVVGIDIGKNSAWPSRSMLCDRDRRRDLLPQRS